jgi:hypothetical protein
MSERKVVYEGPSGIGRVLILEGDFVSFDSYEGKAFFSGKYTNGRYITYRSDTYSAYGSGYMPEDCHTLEPSDLQRHIPISPVQKIKKGFGAFIAKLDDKIKKDRESEND